MPLTTRSISPVNISVGRLPKGLQQDELECVANGSLANLIRQMSSLSHHAHDIFSDIHAKILDVDRRIEKIHERHLRLQDTLDQPNYNPPVSLEGDQLRKPYRSTNIIDQHTLDRSTLPPALAELYEKCDSPPKLNLLNQYRDDSKDALKYYTDPQYFFDLWKEEMLKTLPQDGIQTMRTKVEEASPTRKRKTRTSLTTNRQAPPAPVQSSVVLGHYSAKAQQQNDDFMHFPSEYQAPQFLRNNVTAVDDNLPPPPGMSLHSSGQHHAQHTKHSGHLEEKSAPLATTELSSNLQDLKLTTSLGFDDDDDLPPPPPLSNISNLMPGLSSPTASTSTSTSTLPPLGPLTLVEPPQNVESLPSPPAMVSSTAPPPPPPPPPQISAMTSSTIQSSAVPSFGGQSTSVRETLKPTEGRLNLLEEIRMGRKLKKVELQKEKEEHL
uniref:Wiskott-Aldrich syndrome protein family member n=1 Tax=Panagrolaimus sp. JU765 TaxID=591449 RepID=A0AC34QNH0_9BILA